MTSWVIWGVATTAVVVNVLAWALVRINHIPPPKR
jgi:hypothetical protein